ncbi:MAG: hypothetical protein AAFV53_40915, partial [Myxococcota bacterium]
DVSVSEIAAGLTSLFDDIALRARRDLQLSAIDELTLRASSGERYVIRPLAPSRTSYLYLVVQVPRNTAWRRNTNILVRRLNEELTSLMDAIDADE